MFHKKSPNPEIVEARRKRDELLDAAADATLAADMAVDDLLSEYAEADKQRERNGGRQWS